MQRGELSTGTAGLGAFVASLRYADAPQPVVERTKDLYFDWIPSALAAFESFARTWRPEDEDDLRDFLPLHPGKA